MFFILNIKYLIKLISKIYFIYVLFFSFDAIAENNEVAVSVKDSNSPSRQMCSLLVDWVNSDFKDKTFTIGFSNTARKCLAENKQAHDKLIGSKKTSIIKTEALGGFYSQKFKPKILESYQDKYLSQCQAASMDETKKRALQTRFYASAAKIEATNSTIVDEVAYYDSVLPSPYDSPLMGIDCNTAFLEINNKCVEYKKQTKDCKENQSTRFENLIKKTKEHLTRIGELEKAHRACLSKTRFKYNGQSPPNTQTNEKCKPFFQAIDLIKDQIPWVRGEAFSSIAVKTQPSYRNNYQTEYDEKKIVQAVSDQLHKNRQALVRTFNTNDKNFECLISNNVNDTECDFTKIRSHLASQSDVKASDIFTDNSKEGQEASLQLESDQCLIKYEDDLYQLHNTVKEVGYTVVLTAATLGVGWASGLKVINSVSKLGRSLAIANGTFGAIASGVDLKHTHQECSQESKLVIDLSAKSNLTKENVCSKDDSPLSQAQEKETDCLLGALLSAPGILPFLGSTPGLMKLASASASRSAKTAERVSEPISSTAKSADNIVPPVKRSAKSAERVSEDVLKSNAQQMQNFVANKDFDGARALIRTQMKASGTEVNKSQVEAILNAHIDPKATCGIGKCTPVQLEEKRKIMKEAGLSLKARRDAIERGLAGNIDESNLSSILSKDEIIQHYKFSADPKGRYEIQDMTSDVNKLLSQTTDSTEFNQGVDLLLDRLNKELKSSRLISDIPRWREVNHAKEVLLYNRLKINGGVKGMDLDDVKNGLSYLEQKLESIDPKLFTSPNPNYALEQKLLSELKVAKQEKEAYNLRKANQARASAEFRAGNAAREESIRAATIGARLTQDEKTKISKLKTLLEANPDYLTREQADEFNKLNDYVNEKIHWKDVKNGYSGMLPDDSKFVRDYAEKVDEFVRASGRGTPDLYARAKDQQRLIELPTVEQNRKQFDGTNKREQVISTGAARSAKSDSEIIAKHIYTASGHNVSQLEGYLKFPPVIQQNKELNDIAGKLGQYGIMKKELEYANIVSSMDLNGLERFTQYRDDAFELAERINQLKNTGKWSQVEANLSETEKKRVQYLFDIVEDHQKYFRGRHIRELKKFDEGL